MKTYSEVGSTGSARPAAGGARARDAVLRAALFNRVEAFLREAIARLGENDLMSAVEAPTPGATLARVVAAAPETGLERDEWTEALLRGTAAKQDALRAGGGTFSSGEVAELLGITVAGVKQRQRRGKLLAVPVANGEWGYPARQFGNDGRVRQGLAPVLAAFGEGTDPWVILSFLVNPVPGSDTGTAFDALSDADATATLAEVARTYGEQGAA